ncbi:Flavinator of succinate dehydrogenase-domain-containing protein [Pseudoneurospora amorphoporcata]|uniref:Succinate dehydrogenase assembly factor 2, mitochondrial n=1 Tax=Pseudoneurospora amorphoporcata TaxID=241081 RepID=A0AAN6SJ60_9PEZI|nr:Flavinator of succinate dehydrogenase-domain-containing protein [Pseudoneurospora amorphoporcata]
MASSLRALRPAAATFARAAAVRPVSVSASRYVIAFSRSASNDSTDNQQKRDLDVGELQGATFKIEPLRRVGEDPATMRARLLYQSRKRGTLESDLILSTFAQSHLQSMSPEQLKQYDLFLDENDWDIYYWATQEPPLPGQENQHLQNSEALSEKEQLPPNPRSGEWAQTIGTFKPAYRPVPARWKGSEILELLRQHVKDKGMGRKGGMAFMPRLEEYK